MVDHVLGLAAVAEREVSKDDLKAAVDALEDDHPPAEETTATPRRRRAELGPEFVPPGSGARALLRGSGPQPSGPPSAGAT